MQIKLLDLPGQIAGIFVVLVGALTLFNPFGAGRMIATETARHAGMTGYVYYGTSVTGPAKGMQTFYLVRTGARDFKSLRYGDILQAIRDTNFRAGPSTEHAIMFAVKKEQCVVVLGTPTNVTVIAPNGQWRRIDSTKMAPRKDETIQGGFIEVATTACGMFS